MESIGEIFKIGYGPSSSHTMGPQKAAEIFRDKYPSAKSYAIELYGSLAATGKGHLTDRILHHTLGEDRVKIIWFPDQVLPLHPNGMIFKAQSRESEIIDSWTVYSVGGGSIKSSSDWNSLDRVIYPPTKMDEILDWNQRTGKSLWEYVLDFEELSILDYMETVWQAMTASIKNGLAHEGVLPGPLGLQRKAAGYQIKASNSSGILKEIGQLSSYALAVSEENAGGGQIVTAPTCGSAGVLPAILYYLYKTYDFSLLRIKRALVTAGLIGNLIKSNASISGAEVGCQGEIGSACAMGAAAATQLLGGTVKQIEYAAEMGIEHHLGLTCDPVEGYVQIPCIERNTAAALKALQCATYSIFSDGDHQISFDEVLQTMVETGADMCPDYKETSVSGLAKNWLKSEQKKISKEGGGL